MAEWLDADHLDDMRGPMFAAAASNEPFALATIVAADGGPRPEGSQMVITARRFWGFLSGGCIEADVALHGRAVLESGEHRRLVYGTGSPFIDMRLPCGGRLEVVVERVSADESALRILRELSEDRIPALWLSDGEARQCLAAAEDQAAARADALVQAYYPPCQRLAVIGSDPFAQTITAAGARIGWDVRLIAPFGPEDPAPFDLPCERGPAAAAIAALRPDAWTAIAIATHDLDLDHEAQLAALGSGAGYVGVLGSRKRLAERIGRLRAAGVSEADIGRLHAPIGLDIGARSPWEVAIAVIAEIIAARRAVPGRA